jgi:pimeloyl-ACP methyl ester carboxylesterase
MKQKKNIKYKAIEFIHEKYKISNLNFLSQNSYLLYKNDINYIITLYIKNKNNKDNNTIIFSHSNQSTLGEEYSLLIDLSLMLKCDIISFDYSGYGLSNGIPNDNEIVTDFKSVIYFSKDILNISMNNVILMSESLGNVPLMYFCSNYNVKNIKGLILISPISNYKFNFNKFQNINFFKESISQINFPIFIIHGKKDEIIPIYHSIELSKNVINLWRWFPKKASHYNIITDFRCKFYQKIKFFINIRCNNIIDSLNQINHPKYSLSNNEMNYKIKYFNYGIQREENFIEDDISNDENKEINDKMSNQHSKYTMMKDNNTFNYDISQMSYNY